MENNKLAIVIPTFNRPQILQENLLLMLKEIKKYSIPVYISDDSTNNETQKVISQLSVDYSYFYYKKNAPSLGHDKNCIQTLNLAKQEYVWYLGDSNIIKPNGIKKVLNVIDLNIYDFISVNVETRKLDIQTKEFCNKNILLHDLGWHLTMTSATIYKKQTLYLSKELNLASCKNFPQTAIIFQYFSKKDSKLFWINDRIISGNKNKKSYWTVSVFDVFLNDWSSFITNLPKCYTDINKKYTIKKHSEKSELFTLKKFLNYRSKGIFSYKVLIKYYKLIIGNSKVNITLLLLISIIPIKSLTLIKAKYFPEKL